MIFFACPYSATLVIEDHEFNSKLIFFCVPPQLILLSVELVQIYEQRLSYFYGWNLIDFSQIVIFFTMFYIDVNQAADQPFL